MTDAPAGPGTAAAPKAAPRRPARGRGLAVARATAAARP